LPLPSFATIPGRVSVEMIPDTGYEAAAEESEKSKLAAVKAAMTPQASSSTHYTAAVCAIYSNI
jgi:hypothetical protein